MQRHIYRLLVLAIGYLIVFGTGICGREITNLVSNPGFEEEKNRVPAGWEFEKGKVLLDNEGRTGTHSAKIIWKLRGSDEAEKKKPALISEYVQYKGEKILASCWMRANADENPDDAYSASCDIEFYNMDKGFLVARRVGYINGLRSWEYFERLIDTPDNTGYFRVRFSFNNNISGEAWLDDVYVNIIDRQTQAKLSSEAKKSKLEIKTKRIANIFTKGEEIKFFLTDTGFYEPNKVFKVRWEICNHLFLPLLSGEKQLPASQIIILSLGKDILAGHLNEYLQLRCVIYDGDRILSKEELTFGILNKRTQELLPENSKFIFHFMYGPNLTPNQNMELFDLMGARVVRPCCAWLEPAKGGPIDLENNWEGAPGKYWEELVKEKKVSLAPLFIGAPKWALSPEAVAKYGESSLLVWTCYISDLEALNNFAYKLVTRHKESIKYWLFQCEPPFQTQAAVDGYIKALEAFYAGAKRADPGCFVVAPMTCGGPQWFEAFLASGGTKWCDLYSLHIYASKLEDYEKAIKDHAELMKKYAAVKRIWDDETGLLDPNNKTDEIAGIMIKQFVWHFKYGYEKVFWFAVDTEAPYKLAAIKSNLTPLPLFFAYRASTDNLEVPTEFVEEIELNNESLRLFKFVRDKSSIYVAWNTGNSVDIGFNMGNAKQVVITDTYGRSVNFIPKNGLIGTTIFSPVFIKGKGLNELTLAKNPIISLSMEGNNKIKALVNNISKKTLNGTLNIDVPSDWTVMPAAEAVDLTKNSSKEYVFTLGLPLDVKPGEYKILAELYIKGNKGKLAEALQIVKVVPPVRIDVATVKNGNKYNIKVGIDNLSRNKLEGKIKITSPLTNLARPEELTGKILNLEPGKSMDVMFVLPRGPYNIIQDESYQFDVFIYDSGDNLLQKITKRVKF